MKRIAIIIFVIVSSLYGLAQDVKFTAASQRQVVQGGQLEVRYTLTNASGSNVKYPSFPGFKVLYDAGVSTSQSIQIINGTQSRSSSETRTVILLAEKVGTYTFASATINANGKTYSSNKVTVQVLPPDKNAKNNSNANSSSNVNPVTSNSKPGVVSSSDVFVKTILSKAKVYEQEAVLCTIRLYTKLDITGISSATEPTFEGCTIQELDSSNSYGEIENVNGHNYKTIDIKRCILFPQHSGNITVNQGKYGFTVVQYQEVRDPFWGVMRKPVESNITVSSNKTSINVVPLPTGKPESFIGGVGKFTMTSSLSSNNATANEAITLLIAIKGSGNIKYLRDPQIDFPSDFDVYDPKTDVKATASAGGVSGVKTIEYTIVPRHAGKFKIPSVQISYFDLGSGKYVTMSSPVYDIDVAKGSGNSSNIYSNKEDLKLLNSDIRYIKTGNYKLSKDLNIIVDGPIYWVIYAVLLIIFIILLIVYRNKMEEQANTQLLKMKFANKVARKRLKVAKHALSMHETNKFYEEILKATWGYLSDKLHIPVSSLNRNNISIELEKFGADESLIKSVIEILDVSEMAQYSPVANDEQMDRIYEATSDVIGKMENKRKN